MKICIKVRKATIKQVKRVFVKGDIVTPIQGGRVIMVSGEGYPDGCSGCFCGTVIGILNKKQVNVIEIGYYGQGYDSNVYEPFCGTIEITSSES